METGHAISSHSTGDSKWAENGWGWAGEMEGGEEEGREGGRKKQEGKRGGKEEERKEGKDFPDILVSHFIIYTISPHLLCLG